MPRTATGDIGNKQKRSAVRAKEKAEKAKQRKEDRIAKKRAREELGDAAPPKSVPRTLDNTREADDTLVDGEDDEVEADHRDDEFAAYFAGERTAKIMLTTRPRPTKQLFKFMRELMAMLPNTYFYKRGTNDLKDICTWANNKKFTHLVVLGEKSKVCNQMLVSHLPEGPTALFKVTNVVPSSEIANHGAATHHHPEVILNNFSTRLGYRVGRFFGSLFPHNPQFKARTAVTFHNQRDFIFVRHHRYIFSDELDKARLQELGPRFTLKLKWLMADSFNTKEGEYEWTHKAKEMDTSRRRFFL